MFTRELTPDMVEIHRNHILQIFLVYRIPRPRVTLQPSSCIIYIFTRSNIYLGILSYIGIFNMVLSETIFTMIKTELYTIKVNHTSLQYNLKRSFCNTKRKKS